MIDNLINNIRGTEGMTYLTEGTNTVIALVVIAVIAAAMCFFGLKLIRVWNALIGLLIGAAIGGIIVYVAGVNTIGPLIGIVAGSAVVMAVLSGIFKKFGFFLLTFLSISGVAEGIIQPQNNLLSIVCLAIGLIVAILGMIFFEPLIIIVTSLSGGVLLGSAITEIIGIKNGYIILVICAAAIILGMGVQFMLRSREIGKKEVKHAEKVKEEISKEAEIEQARSILEMEDLDGDDE